MAPQRKNELLQQDFRSVTHCDDISTADLREDCVSAYPFMRTYFFPDTYFPLDCPARWEWKASRECLDYWEEQRRRGTDLSMKPVTEIASKVVTIRPV
jgi:hypothetical protein